MSEDTNRRKIHKVLASVLVPMARTLLRFGVGYSEFSEIAKRAYVSGAERDFSSRGRPVSTSRIALLTGMSRRDVRRLRLDLKDSPVDQVSATSLPAEVLERWYTSHEYLGPDGRPRSLPRSGRNSFESLVAEVSTDISAKTVERELMRAGRLRLVSGKRLMPISREYVPADSIGRALEGFQLNLRRLAETICHNSDERNVPRFERAVVVDGIDQSDAVIVRESVAGILTEFSLTMNDHLASFVRRRKGARSGSRRTLGVGLFFFESDS